MMGLVDCFVAFGLKNLRYPWSRLRQRLFEGRYLKTELPSVHSLKEVQDCLKKITWTQDGFFHLYDALSYPQTVWAKKKDDCDGFAVPCCHTCTMDSSNDGTDVHEIAARNGKESNTIASPTIKPARRSHFILVTILPSTPPYSTSRALCQYHRLIKEGPF
jgi:hypothetical protein